MKQTCEHCGASMMEHKHTLNAGLVHALDRLDHAGRGPVNIKELALTRNAWDNFQKLRYFGLVDRIGKRTGQWQITQLGHDFLVGNAPVQRSVWTYRGEPVRFEGAYVGPSDVEAGYRHWQDYADDMRPHGEAAA